MRGDVLRREIADHRNAIAGWTAGAAALAAMYIFFYPSIRTSGEGIQTLLDTMAKPFRDAFVGQGVDYVSPAGYLGTELFAFLAPVLVMVMGIIGGSRALAAEERNGTIDLLLATPLSRSRLAVEKAIGAFLPVFGVCAVLWVCVAALGPSQGLTVNLGALAVALVAVAFLGVGFGAVAFLVASATGSAGLGGGVAAGVAVTLYLLNLFGSLVTSLNGFANAVSPFHWVGGAGVLVNGVSALNMALLVGCTVVLVAGAVVLYERRDLSA